MGASLLEHGVNWRHHVEYFACECRGEHVIFGYVQGMGGAMLEVDSVYVEQFLAGNCEMLHWWARVLEDELDSLIFSRLMLGEIKC